jgi:hypothetical protein
MFWFGGTATNLIRLQTPKFCSIDILLGCATGSLPTVAQRFSTAITEISGGVSVTQLEKLKMKMLTVNK